MVGYKTQKLKKLVKANIKDKELAIDILTSAFMPKSESNSINLVVKQDKKRKQRMCVLMGYLFERAILFGDVFISDNKKSCLLLSYPHKEKVTLKTIQLDLQLAFQCIGIERVLKVLKRQRVAKKNYPKEKYIKPIILAVKSEINGKGSAARLIIEVKKHFIDNKLPVVIDAASKKNVELYKKFGFRVINKEETLGFPIYYLRLN